MFAISFFPKIQDNCVPSLTVLYNLLFCRDRDHLCVREQLLSDVMEANEGNVKGR